MSYQQNEDLLFELIYLIQRNFTFKIQLKLNNQHQSTLMQKAVCILVLIACASSLSWVEQIALANSLQVGRDQDPYTWGCTGCNAQNKPKSSYAIQENVKNVRASVSVYSEHTVLAFRYTANLGNLWSDIQYLTQKQDQVAPSGCKVQKVWDQMWEAIRANTTRDLKNGNRNNRLIITGISLGGALAQLSFVDINAMKIFTAIQIITFGQPRVGNPAWANWFNKQINTKRFFLSTDPIINQPNCGFKWVCQYQQTNTGYSCVNSGTSCVCSKSNSATVLQKVETFMNLAKIMKKTKNDQEDLSSIIDHINGYKELYSCSVLE